MTDKLCVHILLVEDDEDDYVLVRELLKQIREWTHELVWVATYQEALKAMENNGFDVCLVDYRLGECTGLDLLRQASARGWRRPIILLTGQVDRQVDVEAMQAGAADYLLKEQVDAPILERSIRYALERTRSLQELHRRGEELQQLNASLAEANQKLKETQMYLVQAEKMASLGQLVAGIAHEINNPLSFILNNAFVIENRLEQVTAQIAPQLSAAAKKKLDPLRLLLKDIQTGTERVKDLVVKLRTFSRLEEGTFKTIDVHESIDSVLLFLQHKIRGRIQVEKAYGPLSALTCNAGQLNQVFMNVIANAVDAIEGEGEITVATGQDQEMFTISVRDTGRGIPESLRSRIFEPFFTTKPVGQGTGLGLAISYSIIQAHHGSIEVRSEEGKGTEVVIQIPQDLEQRIESS